MIVIDDLTIEYKVAKKGNNLFEKLNMLFFPQYEIKKALKGINLHIAEGEVIGLVGSNGAGKTSLIKAMSGIIYPTKGKIIVDSFIPSKREKNFRKEIAIVLGQKSKLMWDLASYESFKLYKKIYNVDDVIYNENVKYLVNILDVSHCLNTPVRQLSLGERMKMEFICSLIYNPKIVFLDEPTIGLDIKSQFAIRNFIKEYAEKTHATVIITSHNMQDINTLCNRVVLINKGDVIFDGSLDKLNDYRNSNKIVKFYSKDYFINKGIKRYTSKVIEENGFYNILVKSEDLNLLIAELLHCDTIENLTVENASLEERILDIMGEL